MSQETVNDSSHSRIPKENESNAQGSTLKSAAMLGIALSVGASGALVSQTEASAAVSAPNTSTATKAFSSDSKISAANVAEESQPSQQQIVDYHTVESGESLWQIAQQHGIGLRDLKSANALPPETSIRVGQVLKVPGSEEAGVVASNSDAAQVIARLAIEEQDAEAQPTDELSTADAELSQNSADEPAVLAQAVATDSLEAAPVESIAAPVASIEIEIADASQEEDVSAPVVTALASPAAFSNYQVQAGDTLGSIASSLGITPESLIRSNALTNPDIILEGATLRVPTELSASPSLASKTDASANNAARLRQFSSSSDQLAYLRSTAVRPDAARILDELRSASPEEALSVGGEQITEQDILSTEAQSVDPYVANLMQEVQEIRNQSVPTSEATVSEIESDSVLLAQGDQSDSPSLLSRRVARVSESPATAASADLLAAAPLSPDAYIPAQRSSAGQVVSPDMPILPSADEYLPETPNHFDGYIWPTQGTVTSGYGWRWGRMHRGVDVAGPVGTPIVAAAPGVVEQAGWNSGGFGNLVEIRHPDGSMTRYAHNNTVSVSAGQQVRQGQQIAEMGSTGYSTGPHLHFEVHQASGAVNPVAYLPNR